MPSEQGASTDNIKTEMKDQQQAAAIAYATSRKGARQRATQRGSK